MIAITGATGKLGRKIIDHLLGLVNASEITAVVRTPEKARDLADKGIVVLQGDYTDRASLVKAFADADTLMFISNADVQNREAEHKNVVDAAKQVGVKRIVYTSFVGADLDLPLSYGHRVTEGFVKESGSDFTILRNSFYVDAYLSEIKLAAERGVYRVPTPADAGVAFVSRDDIARMAAAVLASDGHSGKTYNLTGPEVVTPPVFARAAAAVSGKAVVYEQNTWEDLADDYRSRGIPEQAIGFNVELEQMIAEKKLSQQSDDIEVVTGVAAEDIVSYAKRALNA